MQFFRKFYLFFLYLNKNKIIIKLRAEAFSSDTNRLFSQIKVVNLNYPNDLAKPLMAMINYYGGQMSNELTNEKCTHVISINYDDQSNQLENNELKKFKLITPDWFTDCIEQNKLLDELTYNPKFLITIPKNKDIQSRQKIDPISVEPQSVQNSTTNYQIVFKSQLILNDLVLYDETNKQCTPSPTSIKYVSKSDAASSINRILINQQQYQSNNQLINSSNDLSKSLSASSIQAQLENTIRLNSSNNINTNQQMPILIQQLPTMMPLVQTLVPILTNDNATNSTSNTSLNTTPPSASKQQKLKRPRKQSSGSGLSPTHNSVCLSVSVLSNQQANNNSSTFTSEMDEIFQTVLSNAANDDEKSTEIVSAAAFAPITTENKVCMFLVIIFAFYKIPFIY